MKLIKGIDAIWSFVLPLTACGYLIYNKSDYSTYIMLVGWIMFLLHAIAVLVNFNVKSSPLAWLWTLANIIGLITLYALDLISFEGLLILELVSETVAYLVAILFFVLSNQKRNDIPLWKDQGPFIGIMNIILITTIVYPFIAVWFGFIRTVDNTTFYWIGAISALLAAVFKKFSILQMVVQQVNSKTPKAKKIAQEENSENEKSKTFNETPIFVTFIIAWFVVMIILKNI